MENQPENESSAAIVTATSAGATPVRTSWQNLGIIIAALSLIILFLAFYGGYTALVTNVQHLAATSAKATDGQQQQLAQLSLALTDTAANVAHLQRLLAEQQEVIGQIHNTQKVKDALNINEAEYLTALAEDNLQIGDNVPLIISLLQNADHKLRDLSDANLLALRKALALDIAALQAVPAVDTTGLYLQLVALNKQVDKLPLPTLRPTPATDEPSNPSKRLVWWRQGLQEAGATIKKMIVVRYNKAGQLPFITPEQQLYLYQNCHAMLAQAMVALLHKQPQIYQASLAQATAWIRQYFLTDAPATQALLINLAQLQAQNIKPTLPTLHATLQALHDYNGVTQTAATAALAAAN